MKQRGRKSVNQLSTVSELVDARPSAPKTLTAAQKAIWDDVVKCKPNDWFRPDTQPLLANYCRHTTSAAMLGRVIDEFEAQWNDNDDLRTSGAGLDNYNKLLRARDAETKAMVTIGRSMRITQHSLLKAEVAATATQNTAKRKIWETEQE